MFLSWAGRPLFHCPDLVNKADVVKAVTTIFKTVHKLRVLHRDAELRNILCDSDSGSLMVIDFERSEFCGGHPLAPIGPNGVNRKRKHRTLQKQRKNDFARELGFAVEKASGYVASLAVRDNSDNSVERLKR